MSGHARFFRTVVVIVLCVALVPAALAASVKYHLAVVTGTGSLHEDEARGADLLVNVYGSATEGGLIRHVICPIDVLSQRDAFIAAVVSLADDPLLKVVLLTEAPPGSAEAFRKLKALRPDIICIAGEPLEDPLIIQSSADLAVGSDFVGSGFTIALAAHQLGATALVHISSPGRMSFEPVGRQRSIMEQACKDLGLRFASETIPDPVKDLAQARGYLRAQLPKWLENYGSGAERVAFFCTDDCVKSALLEGLLASSTGIFVEGDLPSEIVGYPSALGLSTPESASTFPGFLKKTEQAVVARGGAGRFGTWPASLGVALSAGLCQFAMNVLDGRARLTSAKDLESTLHSLYPSGTWACSYYRDSSTGVESKNQIVVSMDTYIMGNPGRSLPLTSVPVPSRYYAIEGP